MKYQGQMQFGQGKIVPSNKIELEKDLLIDETIEFLVEITGDVPEGHADMVGFSGSPLFDNKGVLSERLYPIFFLKHFFEIKNRIFAEDSKNAAEMYSGDVPSRHLQAAWDVKKWSALKSLKSRTKAA